MQETTLNVSAMSCKSCVARIDRALRTLDGVAEVEVELRRGTVRVRHASALTGAMLAQTISDAGYPARTNPSPAPAPP